MEFNVGDDANAIDKSGKEVRVRIESPLGSGYLIRAYDENGNLAGPPERVKSEQLLRLRGPFFDIRGQVLTSSKQHPNEVGEIIALAETPTGRTYFHVQFNDGASEWFDDDNVLIQRTSELKSNIISDEPEAKWLTRN